MKHAFTLLSLLLLFIPQAHSQTHIAGSYDPEHHLFRPTEAIWADFFEEGVARFYRNGYAGLMDSSGKVLCPARFHEISRFREGIAQVRTNYIYGAINRRGELIAECKYSDPVIFEAGFAIAEQGSKLVMLSAGTGPINEHEYDALTPFSEGRATFLREDKIGLLTPEGKEIVLVRGFDQKEDRRFYIWDRNFEFFLDEGRRQRVPILQLLDGRAVMVREQKDGSYLMGCVDQRGKWAIPAEFEEIRPFREGHAAAKKGGLWGLIDRKGNAVIPFEHDEISLIDPFYVLYSCKEEDEKRYGIMTREGRKCLPCRYGSILPETQSARLTDAVRRSQVMIDPFGSQNGTTPNPVVAESFPARAFLVETDGKWGRMTLSGEERIPMKYEFLRCVPGERFIFGNGGKFGLMDGDGEILIKANLPFLGYLFDGLYLSHNGRAWGVLDENGKQIIPFKYAGISRLDDSRGVLVTETMTYPLNTGVPRYEFCGYFELFDRSGILKTARHEFTRTIEMIADFYDERHSIQHSPLLYMPAGGLEPKMVLGLTQPHLDRSYFHHVHEDFYVVGDIATVSPLNGPFSGRQTNPNRLSLMDGNGESYISDIGGQLYNLGDYFGWSNPITGIYDFRPPKNLFVSSASEKLGLLSIYGEELIPAQYDYLRYTEGVIEAGRNLGNQDYSDWQVTIFDLSGVKLAEMPYDHGGYTVREWRKRQEDEE